MVARGHDAVNRDRSCGANRSCPACWIEKACARDDGVGGLGTASISFGAQMVQLLSGQRFGLPCRVENG